MTAFIALYRGETVSGAQLVAVTADPKLVQDFTTRLITGDPKPEEDHRDGLRLVQKEKEAAESTTNSAKSNPSTKEYINGSTS